MGAPVPPLPPDSKKPAASGPPTLIVQLNPGETEKTRSTRESWAKRDLEEARKALAERDYEKASTLATAAITNSGRPDFGNYANEARDIGSKARKEKAEAEAKQRRASAQKFIEDARTLGASDLRGAFQKINQAKALDPEVEGADELKESLYPEARAQGERALIAAKVADNDHHSEAALSGYEKAAQLLELLPGGHKDLDTARQRIAALKSK